MSEQTLDYGVEDLEYTDGWNEDSILVDVFGAEFIDGVGNMAEVAGAIHALELVGIEPKDGLDYILQMKALEHEKEILKENNKVQIEIAKIQGVQMEKNMV